MTTLNGHCILFPTPYSSPLPIHLSHCCIILISLMMSWRSESTGTCLMASSCPLSLWTALYTAPYALIGEHQEHNINTEKGTIYPPPLLPFPLLIMKFLPLPSFLPPPPLSFASLSPLSLLPLLFAHISHTPALHRSTVPSLLPPRICRSIPCPRL